MRNEMNFIEEVTRVVRIKADYEVEEKTVLKNNGLKLHGLSFKGENLTAPTIYLDSYFTKFTNGEMSFDEIVDEVLSLAKNHETSSYDRIAKDYQDFAKVSRRLMPCLVNAERNADLLKEVPHRKVLDLAIIYKYAVLGNEADGVATITVRNEYLDMWGVTEEDLFSKGNFFPAKIQTLAEIVGIPTRLCM
ncbi:DUF5688 family protein [Eubacterium oxidoreducens]|uniref:Uncharacterized protein n=1 Tax=Eubacterium oxidoreducens TaxID=1732 RepID=A0A1G6B2Y4_EUBOX|nr:DUF5688 family protein [Eubacterium oxidoreducens]SDB14803.1 hypothetical protein SAMN02910417_01080 [Eubacterium oxidoreducens]